MIETRTRKAFRHNVKTEMKAGKPKKQALAIAYAAKRGAEEYDRSHEKARRK